MLQSLNLFSTAISDDGFDELSRFTQLKHLDIQRTQISDEGAKKLARAMPGTQLQHRALP